MTKRSFAAAGAALLACAAGGPAPAADLPSPVVAPIFVAPPAFSWTGVYVGAFVGGGAGTASFSDPVGRSIFGDAIHPATVEGGGAIGYDVQMPRSRVVLGVEADGGAVALTGTTTCLAYSDNVTPYNCRVDGRAIATGTGRIGYAFGADGHTLAYVKGGVAALFEERDISTNNSGLARGIGVPNQPGAVFDQRPQVGFTLGGGLEQALSNAWSLRVEYDYADFGASSIATPQTLSHVPVHNSAYVLVGNPPSSLRQDVHMMKVGLDYRIGAAPGGSLFPTSFFAASAAPPVAAIPAYAFTRGYAFEGGTRYWYSFGHFQRDLGGRDQPNNSLISRLSYASRSSSGELFGRLDTPSRVFLKGFIGAGASNGGHGNDEDFLLTRDSGTANQHVVAYSNTISSNRDDLQYATIDVGYAFLESAATRLGGFVGYNHYRDDNDTSGCAQIASQSSDCVPPTPATGRPGLTQNERFDSLRVGVSGDMWIDRLRLQADAAYLPFVGFNGTDIHHDRFDVPDQVSPEFGRGQGVQLELIASYYLTPNFSVGVGGRYWGFMVPNAITDDFGYGIFPDGVHAERYGVTAQLGYRLSSLASPPVVARY